MNVKTQTRLINQEPNWRDKDELKKILKQINSYPNLVSIDEIELLKQHLAKASHGNGFIIQGGDCAETFIDFNSTMIKNKLKVLLQMSAIIHYTNNINVIKIGRIAGQFAKPRTHMYEIRGNKKLPVYKGDAINDIKYTKTLREHNPKRLLQAYHQSAATMNLIRNLMMEGFTNFSNIQSWGLKILDKSEFVNKYYDIVHQIKNILRFTKSSGISKHLDVNHKIINTLYTSHEALIIDYEKTFISQHNNNTYDCSAHMLWVGDRTRTLNSRHINFVSKIANPIGIKIGPSIHIEDIVKLCHKINPDNKYGKIIFITRLGIGYIRKILPKLISEIKKHKLNVLWLCDPMHGNTINSKNGYKTRSFNTIKTELEYFFQIHKLHGTVPGGVHFEFTGDNVTECIGGINNVQDVDLESYYQTACDPRLNNEQSLEMGFLIAELLQQRRTSK